MAKMLPSSKLFPITILATAGMLVLKSVALLTSVPSVSELRLEATQALAMAKAGVIAQAHAATSASTPPPSPLPAPASPSSAPTRNPLSADPVTSAIAAQPRQAAAPEKTPPVSEPGAPEGNVAGPEALALRRSQVENRERRLDQREATLAATDKRLKDRVAELVALQSKLQVLEEGRKQADEANWAGLVKLYEGMGPRQAAQIFDALDKPVLLEILDRMKPTKAAPVLAAMDAEKARQATADLAAKRSKTVTATN